MKGCTARVESLHSRDINSRRLHTPVVPAEYRGKEARADFDKCSILASTYRSQVVSAAGRWLRMAEENSDAIRAVKPRSSRKTTKHRKNRRHRRGRTDGRDLDTGEQPSQKQKVLLNSSVPTRSRGPQMLRNSSPHRRPKQRRKQIS
jgi:hypothetical protein